MRGILKAITVTSAFALSQPALADASCGGTLSGKFVDHNGAVIIQSSWRGDWTMICNIKTVWNGITPDVCATWVAMADAAIAMGRGVEIYYYGSYSCATLAIYGASPSPYYVMLR